MYKKLLALVSMIILLFAVSCGGGGAALPDPGQQGGGGAPVIPVDDIAPEIVLSGLTEGSSYGIQEAGVNTLNLKGVAADPSGITNMALRINNTLVASSNDSQVSFDWDVTGFSDGTYEVLVQAADGEGNVAETSMTVYVDNVVFVAPVDLFPELVLDPGIFDPFPLPDPFPFFPGI